VAGVVSRIAISRSPHPSLVRLNVAGRYVPAVLGLPLLLGGACGMAVAAGVGEVPDTGITYGIAVLLLGMAAAGFYDDLRGDEVHRGFRGHISALRAGRVSGGMVKVLVGGGSGLVAGAVVGDGARATVEIGLCCALAANLLNLLDRAPGRAGKAALIGGLLLVLFGDASWGVAAAGTVGATAALLPIDLGERGMLGDMGANPLGAVLGLGLAVAGGEAFRLGALAALLGLNLVSEVWSFSAAIERVGILRAWDRLGRK
jgi:UDP-GlcNAc:undecaprenyl-phosphate GlcNAc-1-phosphate transferase